MSRRLARLVRIVVLTIGWATSFVVPAVMAQVQPRPAPVLPSPPSLVVPKPNIAIPAPPAPARTPLPISGCGPTGNCPTFLPDGAQTSCSASGGCAVDGGTKTVCRPDGDCSPAAAGSADAPYIENITRWEVHYGDALLGEVKGEAFVNWDAVAQGGGGGEGSAHVVLESAAGKPPYALYTNAFSVSGIHRNQIRASFRGSSPESARVTPPTTNGLPTLGVDDGESITLTFDKNTASFGVSAKASVTDANIGVQFVIDRSSTLVGIWSHDADPLTERGINGGGRVGGYRLLNASELAERNSPSLGSDAIGATGGFLGIQAGVEIWWPKPTVIDHIAVIEDQLAYRGGIPMFYRVSQSSGRADDPAYHRTLLIVGRNLPLDKGRPLARISQAYTELSNGQRVPDSFGSPVILATTQDKDISPENTALMAKGWQRIVDELNDRRAPDSPLKPFTLGDVQNGMEAALVRVAVKPDARPGPQWLVWGTGHPWLLQFGGNTIETHFVRPLTMQADGSVGEVEPAEEFYRPEQVAVELIPNLSKPDGSLPVQVSGVGPMTAVPTRTIKGRTVYRTPFFAVPQQQTSLVAFLDQKKLLDQQGYQFLSAPMVKAKLSVTPAGQTGGRLAGLWHDAVIAAARVHGVDVTNLSQRQTQTVASLAPVSVFDQAANLLLRTQPLGQLLPPVETVHKIPISLADHAAMLLLRDNFIEMSEGQEDWLSGLTTDDDMQKLLQWLKPYVYFNPESYPPNVYVIPPSAAGQVVYWNWLSASIGDRNLDKVVSAVEDVTTVLGVLSTTFKQLQDVVFTGGDGPPTAPKQPFAQLQVTGLDGAKTTLYAALKTIDDPPAGVAGERFRQWKIDLAKGALGKYLPAVKRARVHAEAIKDSDIEGLLKLTGVGFDATVQHIVPRLMRLRGNDAQSLAWEPDRIGRSSVLNLATTAKAVQAQEDLNDIETQYVVLVASSMVMVPAMVTEGAIGAVVSLAGNILIWEGSSILELIDTHKSQTDLQIEFGNAAVLGTERLGDAAMKKTEWYQALLSIGVQGVFVGLQAAVDALPKVARAMNAEKAVPLVAKISRAANTGGGAKAFKALAVEQQSAVMAMAEEGAVQQASAQPLSLDQRRSIAAARQIGREVGPVRPGVTSVEPPVDFGQGKTKVEQPVDFGPGKTKVEQPVDFGPTTPGSSTPESANNSAFTPEELAMMRAEGEGEAAARQLAAEEAARINEGLAREFRLRDAPAAYSRYYNRSGDGGKLFKLGKAFTAGGSSEVYVLLEIDGNPVSEPSVIKFVLKDSNLGTPVEQIERMSEANELLKAARKGGHPIEFAEVSSFDKTAERPFLIQKMVGGEGEVFVDYRDLMETFGEFKSRPKSFDQVLKSFDTGKQRAVLKLYRALADNGLLTWDMSLANIYFKPVGGEWVAGVLDVDLIGDIRAPRKNLTWDKLFRIIDEPTGYAITSLTADGRAIGRSSLDFSEKMLECWYAGNGNNGWIEFDQATKTFKPILIDPALVKEYFPNFRISLDPPPAAGLLKKQGSLYVPPRNFAAMLRPVNPRLPTTSPSTWPSKFPAILAVRPNANQGGLPQQAWAG